MKKVDFISDEINPFTGESWGWIQWKGTSVCMDVHCLNCHQNGLIGHVDAEFAYFLHCQECNSYYQVSQFVRLIPITKPGKNEVEPIEVDMQ